MDAGIAPTFALFEAGDVNVHGVGAFIAIANGVAERELPGIGRSSVDDLAADAVDIDRAGGGGCCAGHAEAVVAGESRAWTARRSAGLS